MSNAVTDLDPVIVRQLRKAGLLEPSMVPSAAIWAKFLSTVSAHYRHLNDDRALLARSMELSTSEMDELRRRVEAQRDQLSSVVDTIAEALGMFGGIVQKDEDATSVATGLTYAKDELGVRLAELFTDEGSDSQQISGIRTNLVRLVDQLIRLLAETAERAAVKKELEVARAVQNLLVPAEDVMDRPYLRIAGHFQPASECGGDWWGVYDLSDGRVLAIIGDATGHGISSAIITGAAKAACDLACNVTQGRLAASDLLKMMNSAIHETARRQIMMTSVATIFDPRTKTLEVANAGHHFPYHVRNGELRPIMAHGQPLGASSSSTYESTTVPFASNDLFVWFTDGIVECENERGDQFTEKKLRAVCQRAASGGARAVRDAVIDAVSAFQTPGSQSDDMTLVVASVK